MIVNGLSYWLDPPCTRCNDKGLYGVAYDAVQQVTPSKPPPLIHWHRCMCINGKLRDDSNR